MRGESISDIARALERSPGTIHCTLKERGGVAPAQRRRRASSLTVAEREEISRGIAAGASVRSIAWTLQRAPSTVSREITRNGGRDRYRAASAERRAEDAARRPQRCKLSLDDALRDVVAAKLSEDWSPEQISGWLVVTYPDDPSMRVSPETIYLTLFLQGPRRAAARTGQPSAPREEPAPATRCRPRQSRPGRDHRCRLDP